MWFGRLDEYKKKLEIPVKSGLGFKKFQDDNLFLILKRWYIESIKVRLSNPQPRL